MHRLFLFFRKFSFKLTSLFYCFIYKKSKGGFGPRSYINEPQNVNIGFNFYFRYGLRIEVISNGIVNIGNDFSCGENLHLAAINEVCIGHGVLIGSNVLVTDHSHGSRHDYATPPSNRELISKGKVIINDRVWIGDGVIILSGVTIGEGATIGANCIITKNVPENSTVVMSCYQRII